MNFGQAIEEMKAGRKCHREGWNGKNMFVFIVNGPEWTFTNGMCDNQPLLPFICMQTVTGEQVPWLASQTDMLAEDWCSDLVN